ncbi:MAG: hypothetical protein WC711_04030 [Candidatus Staskawiczbacteria bacterium]|jgi:hypothetical protein
MVDFNTLDNYTITDVSSLLAYPSSVDTNFWAWVMFAIFMIISLTFYFRDKALLGEGNFLSSGAVGSLITLLLSIPLTLMGVIDNSLFVKMLVLGVIVIAIWFFKKD